LLSAGERAALQRELENAQKRVAELEKQLGFDHYPIDPQDLFKATVEQTIEGIQIIDRNWKYIYINSAAAEQGKSKSEALLGRTMMECYPGIERTELAYAIQNALDGGAPRQLENLFEFPDGSRCWFELLIEPHTMGALIRSVDITDRKRIEEQFNHSQKMESIGLLAGGMAHDFNNKLGIMMIYADLIKAELSDEQDHIQRYLDNIMIALRDASALTKQLLAFSRKQVLDLRVTNLNDIINYTSDSLRKLIGENIQLRVSIDEELHNVRVDPSQMDQVILNLVVNARDAMPEGGTLVVETANVELDKEYCSTQMGVEPGPYVMLAISDTGLGMSADVRSRIFEPFYTTKAKGKGTGLGLSSVHGIVNQSRGHIWVYSEPGRGTTFKLYFPEVQERKQNLNLPNLETNELKGTETLLVAEDDQLLRQALTKALETAGYKVFAAADPSEAKKLFMEQKGQFAMLLTDVIMPQSSGHDLATDLSKLKPDLKVVYISGYTENIMAQHQILDSNSILIQKPIATKKLLSSIRQVLDGKFTKGVIY
jgi:PAS domain S-box-containing protein